ncbi:MAG: PH domain-containing protein [Micrococcales bacterium]|nr:PH domain-containing protein [Micrococcales bacterium]
MTREAAAPLDATFRPRRGRVVPLVVAGVFVLICVAVSVGMGVAGEWTVGDQVALVVFGLLVGGFLARYAAIRATPGPDGLTVRNLMLTRTVGWDEIEAVRFVEGDPWVSLELVDTDVVAVMAVQRVDGDRGRAEARRLLELVRAHRRS